MFGNRCYFRELVGGSEEGISTNILASRLKQLVAAGLLTQGAARRGAAGGVLTHGGGRPGAPGHGRARQPAPIIPFRAALVRPHGTQARGVSGPHTTAIRAPQRREVSSVTMSAADCVC